MLICLHGNKKTGQRPVTFPYVDTRISHGANETGKEDKKEQDQHRIIIVVLFVMVIKCNKTGN